MSDMLRIIKDNINEDNIDYLYEVAQAMDDSMHTTQNLKFDKDELLDMIGCFQEFGGLRETVKRSNEFFDDFFGYGQHPFRVSPNDSSQYTKMDETNIEEIVANEVVVSNRLAKIANAVIEDIVNALPGKDKQERRKNERIFNNLYAHLSLQPEYTEFMETHFLDNDGSIEDHITSKKGIKYVGDPTRDSDGNTKYEVFEKIFCDELNNTYSATNIGLSEKNIPAFQRYAKMLYCMDIFYKAKSLSIEKCIDLSQKKDARIKVSDASRFDYSGKANERLIQIDLPAYTAPILAHDSHGHDASHIKVNLPMVKSLKETYLNPIWSFKMNDEQRKFIRTSDPVDIWKTNDKKYMKFGEKLTYMKTSDKWECNIVNIENIIKAIKTNSANHNKATEKFKKLEKTKNSLEWSLIKKKDKDKEELLTISK